MEYDLLKVFAARVKITEDDLATVASDLGKLAKAIAASGANLQTAS
jgi:hypothetical protein